MEPEERDSGMVECPCGISYDDGQAMIECERCKVCIAAYSSYILLHPDAQGILALVQSELDARMHAVRPDWCTSVIAELDIGPAVAGLGSHLMPQ